MDKEQIIKRLHELRIHNLHQAKMYARLARTDKDAIRAEAYKWSSISCREDALIMYRALKLYQKHGK